MRELSPRPAKACAPWRAGEQFEDETGELNRSELNSTGQAAEYGEPARHERCIARLAAVHQMVGSGASQGWQRCIASGAGECCARCRSEDMELVGNEGGRGRWKGKQRAHCEIRTVESGRLCVV
eukprot:108160-Pleurochrysis_carterae.AAC.2